MQSMFKIKWKLYYIMVRMFNHLPVERNYNSAALLPEFLKGGKAVKRKHFYERKTADISLYLFYMSIEIVVLSDTQ